MGSPSFQFQVRSPHRAGSVAAALVLLGSLAAPVSADPPVVIEGMTTTPVDLGNGGSLDVRPGGSIESTNDAVTGGRGLWIRVRHGGLLQAGNGNDGIDVDSAMVWNWGSIIGNGDGVELDDFGTVYNWGLIEGTSDNGVEVDSTIDRSSVFNWGTIRGEDDGIDNTGGAFLSVHNWGQISGRTSDGIDFGNDGGIVFNFGRILSHADDGEGVEFEGKAGTVFNFGVIEQAGPGSDNSGVEFDFDSDFPAEHAQVYNAWYGRILSRAGAGIELEGDDDGPGERVTIGNFGLIQGRLGVNLEDDTDKRIDIWNFGIIRGRDAAVLLDLDSNDTGNLLIKGTGTFIGGVRGEGPDDTLRLRLHFIPKEDVARLRGLHGQSPGSRFALSNGRLDFEGFEHVVVEEALSGELEARSGLEEFGRSLDWTRVSTLGEVPELLAGLSMEAALGTRRLNEAFETVSGRAQHHLMSDNAFQVATQLSTVHQRYFDRVRERRRHGFHGGALAMRMDSGIAGELSQITGRQYASANGIVVADVIDEPAESPPPRRRVEPTPPPAPAPAAPEIAGEEPVWGGFMSAVGVFGDQDHTGSRVNSDWVTAGATLGLDRELGPGLVGGLLFGYLRTDADVDGKGSDLDDDQYLVGPYLAWGGESGWHASASAIYGWHDYEIDRQIQLPGFDLGAVTLPGLRIDADSSPDGHQFTSYFSGGYDWHTGAEGSEWTVGPYAALQFSLLHIDSYGENGAGELNLDYDDQTAHSLQTHLGVRINREITCEMGTLVPELRAMWGHEFMDDDRNIRTSFNTPEIPRFTVSTHRADADFGIIGAAMTGTLERWRNIHFFAGYDARIGQDDYVGHAANAGVWVQF